MYRNKKEIGNFFEVFTQMFVLNYLYIHIRTIEHLLLRTLNVCLEKVDIQSVGNVCAHFANPKYYFVLIKVDIAKHQPRKTILF